MPGRRKSLLLRHATLNDVYLTAFVVAYYDNNNSSWAKLNPVSETEPCLYRWSICLMLCRCHAGGGYSQGTERMTLSLFLCRPRPRPPPAVESPFVFDVEYVCVCVCSWMDHNIVRIKIIQKDFGLAYIGGPHSCRLWPQFSVLWRTQKPQITRGRVF